MSTLLLANGCEAPREQHALALETIARHYRNRLGMNQLGHVAARYKLVLNRVRDQGRTISFRVQVRPLVAGKDNEDEKTTSYKHPKGAIEEIPEDPEFVYRGMSWEEWMAVRKTCKIHSEGGYNLGQKGYTFFGSAGAAVYYASGFTPWMYKPAMGRPGVVVAVEKEDVLKPRDRPGIIPEGEYAVHWGLSARRIQELYIVVAKEVRWGYFELELDKPTARVSEGSASGVSVWTAIVKVDAYQARADC